MQMEIQQEKDRVVELTNETKQFKALKKVQSLLLKSTMNHMNIM